MHGTRTTSNPAVGGRRRSRGLLAGLRTAAEQIDRGVLRRLWREGLPEPLDVPNLIDLREPAAYGWYALTVAPVLRRAGGRVLWHGAHALALQGAPLGDTLMIVRYPRVQQFLAMVSTPYYLAINRFRERGVARFHASFTTPAGGERHPGGDARIRGRTLVAVHAAPSGGGPPLDEAAAQAALAQLHAGAAALGLRCVYASRVTSGIGFIRAPRPVDPNPMPFALLSLFAVDGERGSESAAPGMSWWPKLAELAPDASIQLYVQQPLADKLPWRARRH